MDYSPLKAYNAPVGRCAMLLVVLAALCFNQSMPVCYGDDRIDVDINLYWVYGSPTGEPPFDTPVYVSDFDDFWTALGITPTGQLVNGDTIYGYYETGDRYTIIGADFAGTIVSGELLPFYPYRGTNDSCFSGWQGPQTPQNFLGSTRNVMSHFRLKRHVVPLDVLNPPDGRYQYILVDEVRDQDEDAIHPDCVCPNCNPGMAIAAVNFLQAGLMIKDRPLTYEPAYGPHTDFVLSYDRHDETHVGNEAHGHLGPKWVHNWMSYVVDEPSRWGVTTLGFVDEVLPNTIPGSNVHIVKRKSVRNAAPKTSVAAPTAGDPPLVGRRATVHIRGGAGERYESSPTDRENFGLHAKSKAKLVRVAAGHFTRTLPDGTVETYSTDAGVISGEHRIYLTSVVDADGNAISLDYDTGRITSITDATGHVTTFQYFNNDERRLWKVIDPYGRTVVFNYDLDGRLWKITDPVGIVSEFHYEGSTSIIDQMKTPYGTSSFVHAGNRLKLTDPEGGIEMVEFRSEGKPPADTATDFPTGFTANGLSTATTYYWNKKAMEEAGATDPLDADATVTNWLYNPGTSVATAIPGSVKKPGEGRVWFSYPGQTQDTPFAGTGAHPIKIARVLKRAEGGAEQIEQISQMHYNAQGLLDQSIDPKLRKTEITYHAGDIDVDEVRRYTGATTYDVVSKFTAYEHHRPTIAVDAAGQTTTFEYQGPGGQVSKITNTKSEVTKFDYVPANTAGTGKVQTVTRAFGTALASSTSFTYDAYGRLETVTENAGDSNNSYTVTIGYDAIGSNPLKTLDRPTRTTFPDSTYQEITWDRLDAGTVLDRAGRKTITEYDGRQRPIRVTDPAGRIVQYGWCLCGSLEQIKDAAEHVTTFFRDLNGRVTDKTIEGTPVASYTYDLAGRLETMTDARHQVVTYGYDLDDKMLSIAYNIEATFDAVPTPNVSFSYSDVNGALDPYGRLRSMTSGTGNEAETTVYDYIPVNPADAIYGDGQIASVDGPLANDALTYSYDELGRTVSGPRGTISGFDTLGRVTGWTNGLGSFEPHYVNHTSRLDRLDEPGGRKTEYDWFGMADDFRLKQIQHVGPTGDPVSQFDYTYDVLGRISKWVRWNDGIPTGTAARRWVPQYDDVDQLTDVDVKDDGNGAALEQFRYSYDLAGNREGAGSSLWTVNALNQLTGQVTGGVQRVEGTVSEPSVITLNGRRAQVVPDGSGYRWQANLPVAAAGSVFNVEATETNVSPGNNAQRTKWTLSLTGTNTGSATDFEYDLNGNMTSDGGTRTFEWDAANRLAAINYTGTNRRSEFSYDGLGRRIRIKELDGMTTLSDHRLVWDGMSIFEERDATTDAVLKHFFGEGEQRLQSAVTGQAADASYLYTRDHLGSVREVIDLGDDQLMARYDYDPYGVRTRTSGVIGFDADLGYTGHWHHKDSGLELAPFRGYDAKLGRWLSRDWIEENGGLNLYGYVGGDPIRLVDHLGFEPIDMEFMTGMNFAQWVAEAYQPVRLDHPSQIAQSVRSRLGTGDTIGQLTIHTHGYPGIAYFGADDYADGVAVALTDHGWMVRLSEETGALLDSLAQMMDPNGAVILAECDVGNGTQGTVLSIYLAQRLGVPVMTATGGYNPLLGGFMGNFKVAFPSGRVWQRTNGSLRRIH